MRMPKLPKLPRFVTYITLVVLPLSLVPFALVALSRAKAAHPLKDSIRATADKTRVHLILDMDNQARLNAQSFSAAEPFGDDSRAMRLPVEGTIAQGELHEDDHLYLGFVPGEFIQVSEEVKEKKWYEGYPKGVEITESFVHRGKKQYEVYCGVCHGQSGNGNGMIWVRAQTLSAENNGMTPPKSMIDLASYGEEVYPNGKLYDIIVNGSANRIMPGYREQISVEDRWAIIAYIRALQYAQRAPVDQLPRELRP